MNDLKEIKRVGLEILQEYIRVCEKLNLKYYLAYGSLIGAIRHGGYIPWDDDVDVCMPRPDYDKFMELGRHELNDGYFLQNKHTDPQYVFNFAKLRDSRTTLIETGYENQSMNHGIFIDIFPMDGYIKGKDLVLDIRVKEHAYEETSDTNVIQENLTSAGQKLMKVLGPAFIKQLNKDESMMKMEEKAKKFPFYDCEYVADVVGGFYVVPMKREVFGEGKIVKFEGIDVRVPDDYDTYLRLNYGDYMELPPVEKQVPHHNYLVVDTKTSYVNYIGEFGKVKKVRNQKKHDKKDRKRDRKLFERNRRINKF